MMQVVCECGCHEPEARHQMHKKEHHRKNLKHSDHSHTDIEIIQPLIKYLRLSENSKHFYHSQDSDQSVKPR